MAATRIAQTLSPPHSPDLISRCTNNLCSKVLTVVDPHGKWDSSGYQLRNPGMRRNLSCLAFALTAASCLLVAAGAAAASPTATSSISDGVLKLALPLGWFGSVAPGTVIIRQSPHTASWMLVGDYHAFLTRSPTAEGMPKVPRGRVVVSIGDFPASVNTRAWLPLRPLAVSRLEVHTTQITRHVRFHGRAIIVTVRFGSAATSRGLARVNRLLSGLTAVDRAAAMSFASSRLVRFGPGRAVARFTLHEHAGVILVSRITTPQDVQARFLARIPELAGAGASTFSSNCRTRGSVKVCTQPEEWCPMPQAVWQVNLVKLSGPAAVVRVDFVVGTPPPGQ
jgi:hypothetical protein